MMKDEAMSFWQKLFGFKSREETGDSEKEADKPNGPRIAGSGHTIKMKNKGDNGIQIGINRSSTIEDDDASEIDDFADVSMTYVGDGGMQIGVNQASKEKRNSGNKEEDGIVKIYVSDFAKLALSGGFRVTLHKSAQSYLVTNDHNVAMMVDQAGNVLRLDRGKLRGRRGGNSIGSIQGSNIGTIIQSGSGKNRIGGVSDEEWIDVEIYCQKVPEFTVNGNSKVALGSFHSDDSSGDEDKDEADKREKKPTRHPLKPFESLLVSTSMNVRIVQSDAEDWSITSPFPEDMDFFHFEDDRLVIDHKGSENAGVTTMIVEEGVNFSGQKIHSIVMNNGKMTVSMDTNVINIGTENGYNDIVLNIPRLPYVTLSGLGNVSIDGFHGDKINYINAGNGNIKHNNVETSEVRLMLNGSGNINLRSNKDEITIDTMRIELNGIGNVKAQQCKANKVIVHSSGLGNVKVRTNEIEGVLSGVGNISIYGPPPKENVQIIGMGKIKYRG